MRNETFTKGRWIVCDTGSGALEIETKDLSLAEIYDKYEFPGCPSRTEAKANAHLIAAAPEMYEMLAEIMYSLECGNSDHVEINDALIPRVQCILEKARGER